MGILNINLDKYRKKAVEIYTKIFGKEYETIIRKRIESVEIVTYNSEKGIRKYKIFLENCKARELSIEFLRKIGIDVSKAKGRSFAEELPDDLRKLAREYFCGNSGFTYFPEKNNVGIRGFKKKTKEVNSKDTTEKQIRFINFFLGNEEIVDEYELEEFLRTEEGREVLKKIEGYNKIFNEILKKYQEYEKTLGNIEDFLEFRKNTDITKTEEFEEMKKLFSKFPVEGDVENDAFYLLNQGKVFVTINPEKPVLFYTILEGGGLDYTMLHEFCHVIEKHSKGKEKIGSGFDITKEKNPYRPEKRKYERLNENITDIFSIRATKILHEREEYLLEPKEIVLSNIMDVNTSSITKNMLMPFLKRYKQEIIRARITGDINSLLEVVGKDNFEELNDCINVVDYFIYEKGLSKILEKRANNDRKEKEKDIESTEEEVIEEYEKQLQRLDRIYISMEENLKSNNQER